MSIENNEKKKPDFMMNKFGFNKYSEIINGRIAMIAFIFIFLLEAIFQIRLTKIFFNH